MVAATLAAALASAGALSLAEAAPTVSSATPTATVTAGPTVADLLPAPAAPDLDIPDVPLPEETAEPSASSSGHCDDPAWWNARQVGDPGDYVAACGSWPSWIDPPVDGSGAAPYTGPTEGRAWSPEYGYYEGRTDGPKNSQGEPCMQGRDNNDPNC
ncbi:hypothetical protein [Pseudonocardia endophytica]|uniref:hypothetical protein n=1 Tax=Pseudonocardia endophytica TaxID=401976 RepID=UPI00104EBB0A|nr:hypothetical protein [Pseudonocardia endophytica]